MRNHVVCVCGITHHQTLRRQGSALDDLPTHFPTFDFFQIDDMKNPSKVTVKRMTQKADQKLKEEEATIEAYKKKVLTIKKASRK